MFNTVFPKITHPFGLYQWGPFCTHRFETNHMEHSTFFVSFGGKQ